MKALLTAALLTLLAAAFEPCPRRYCEAQRWTLDYTGYGECPESVWPADD